MISKDDILNASILIVDDQSSNVFLLEELLRSEGYRCLSSTTDPFAVVELHRSNRYDLILLDLMMPGLNGFQIMELLKEIENDSYLPVLVITAQPDHKLRALSAGAKDFVSKPFDLVEVQTRIRNMLEVRLLYKKLDNYNKELEQTVLERTAELRDSEARFRRLSELSSDWFWEQDENNHFTRINGPVLDMLGIAMDGQWDASNDGWKQDEREQLKEHISMRDAFLDFVYSRSHPDGSISFLMVSAEPMFDDSGRYIGYRGTGKDVTESIGILEPSTE